MVPDSAQALFSVPASLILGAPEALPFVRERNLKHPGTAEGLEPSPSGPPSFRPVTIRVNGTTNRKRPRKTKIIRWNHLIPADFCLWEGELKPVPYGLLLVCQLCCSLIPSKRSGILKRTIKKCLLATLQKQGLELVTR